MANPKLRFKRLDGTAFPDWEKKPLSSIFEEVSEKGYTDLPVLSIVQGKGTIVRDDSDRRISYDKTNVKGYKRVLFGDYIIHLRSFEGGLEMSNHDGIVSPAYHVLRNSGSTINKPLYRPYFRSFDFITNRLAPSVVGIRDGKSIDMDTFWETTIPYPSVDEQRRMADFFVAVDKKIEAKEQYVAALETQKKELLRQVFAREIRLKDENGQDYPEWEEHSIGDYLESRDERQVPTEEAPLMAFIANIGVAEKGEKYDRSHLIKSNDKKYKRTEYNDFIYSSNNLDVGSIGLNTYGTAVISIVYEIFKPKGTCAPSFISNYIQSKPILNKVLAFRQGCLYGQYRIYAEDFLSVEVLMPSLPEQQRIADFFMALDAQIENEWALLEDWRQLKKGLLQKMFV